MQDKAELNNNSSHYINDFSNRTNHGTNHTSVNSSKNLVELPLPSKNQHIGKKIVKKLLIESENVVSKTQFNARSPNNNNNNYCDDDNDDEIISLSHPTGLQRASTVVNYENRHAASVGTGEFESKLLGSPNSGSIEQMSCAAMFGKQYLLIGNENGLSVIDFSVNPELMKPKQIIRGCSFKKIQILDEYGIMIAISGKKQMIRIYKLDSLLHLIKFILQLKVEKPVDFSKKPAFLKKFTDSIQRCDDCGFQLDENEILSSKAGKLICQNCKELRRQSTTSVLSSTSSESNSSTSTTGVTGPSLFPGKLHQRTLSNITSYIHHHLSSSLDNIEIDAEERTNLWSWATDYVKLMDSARDCTTFDIKETKSYIYLTVVTPHNMIHLFNCEVATKNTSDFKFELAQTFWVPVTPDFIDVANDAYVISKIFTCMNGRAAYIDAHSNVVTEINMSKVLIPRFVENPVWKSFTPLPHTCSLEFLVENPIEFDTRISFIPLSSLNTNVYYDSKSPPSPASPTTPPPSDSTNNVKFVDELRSNPLRRSTYRHRKSISSTNEFQSSGLNYKKSRRRSAVTDETINSIQSPLDTVAFMLDEEEEQQPQVSPTFNNVKVKRETVSIMQQLPMMVELDYVAPPERLPNRFPTSDQESHSKIQQQQQQQQNSSENKQKPPIEAPSPSTLFLATINNVSHLVNCRGEPYKYNRPIRWSSPPNKISLLPSFNDICVIGFQNTIIELASMKSGEIIKKITSGCSVKFLGESWIKKNFNSKTVKKEKNKKHEIDSGMRRNVFWSCELGEEYYFYRGRILNY